MGIPTLSPLTFGADADTNIYRSAADTLKTDDAFSVNGNTILYANGAVTSVSDIQAQSGGSHTTIGAIGPSGESGLRVTADTNLYRSAANILKTDDAFVAVGSVTASGLVAGNLGLTAGGYIAGDSTVQLLAEAASILYLGADADTGLIYTRRGMRFSAGKVLDWAGDANLYRSGANYLKTDDAFVVAGEELNLAGAGGTYIHLADAAAASTIRIYSSVSGDSGDHRFKIQAGGTLMWAGSATSSDTNLYRSSANVLKTDDAFVATGSITGNSLIAPALTTGAIYGTDGTEPYLTLGSSRFQVNARAATYVGLTVKGFTAQSAHLQDWRDSADTVLSYVSSTGEVVANALYMVGTINFGGDANLYRPSADNLKTDDTFTCAALVVAANAVTFADADSGGTGYRLLRVPN